MFRNSVDSGIDAKKDDNEEDMEMLSDLSDMDSNAEDDFYNHELDLDNDSAISSVEENNNDVTVGNGLQNELRYFQIITFMVDNLIRNK